MASYAHSPPPHQPDTLTLTSYGDSSSHYPPTESAVPAYGDHEIASPGETTKGHNLNSNDDFYDRHMSSGTDVDEVFNPYSDEPNNNKPGYSDASLVHNAAGFGGVKDYRDPEYVAHAEPGEGAPLVKDVNGAGASPWQRLLGGGKYPLEQRIDQKRRGIGRQRYPFVTWVLSMVMVAVFIYELVINSQQQGTPVSFHPVVNPMLGPSSSALINVGARFPPCMKDVTTVPISTQFPCMNDTANPPDRICTFESLCGFGGIPATETPNQWWRFITPIFLHAGVVHILLNLLAQLTAGAQVEKEMGSAGFFLLYFAAGIFGNILGGNFSLVGVPSVGASGAIFGTVGVAWIDLLAHWKIVYQPGRRLVFLVIELVLGVAVGFIPYVDNFAHLGGLLMGLMFGMMLYPIISQTPRHKIIIWVLRIAAIPLAIVLFVVLIRNFYKSDPYAACSWCRYLSCIPTSANNQCKGTGLSYTTTTTSTTT